MVSGTFQFLHRATWDGPRHSVSLSPSPWCISLGLVASAIFCIPFGLLNLDENLPFQWFSFVAMFAIILEFVVQFFWLGPEGEGKEHHEVDASRVAPFRSDNSRTLGVIAFSWAFVVTIPSWLNEKRRVARHRPPAPDGRRAAPALCRR